MKESVKAAGASGILLELDGGLHSTVVAALARRAAGYQATGLLMPCIWHPEQEEDALRAAREAGVITITVRLGEPFAAFRAMLPGIRQPAVDERLKARLRSATLFHFADHLNYLTAGPQDRDTIEADGFTTGRDAWADLLPVGGLSRKDVRQLARELNLPAFPVRSAAPQRRPGRAGRTLPTLKGRNGSLRNLPTYQPAGSRIFQVQS
jgi:NAD+ synthase